MSTLLQYKCPCCGGRIEFDSSIQKMKCPFCDTEFDVAALQSNDEVLNQNPVDDIHWNTDSAQQWAPGETEGMRVYTCKSCGGEIVTDQTTAASSCPYCDNPIVMTGQFTGDLKPDYVIPFKLNKEAAKAGLLKHLMGKRLLPKVFKDQNHIDEIKGVYVPFWLFDAQSNGHVQYRAENVRCWTSGDYEYIETTRYAVHRGGSVCFERIPVDGSTKMDDDLMESIEPYDFRDAVDFQTAYLSGYLADKYDVNVENSIPRINERVKKSTEQAFESTVNGYTSVTPEFSSISVANGVVKYALYPVWILNTTYNGKKYTFAMNGQTGKFVGDLPMDKNAYFKWLSLLSVACSAGVALITVLLWLIGIL